MTDTNPREQAEAPTELEALQAENHLLKTAGIIEVAVRNPNVSEYMRHWEGRAEKAETECRKQALEILSLHGQAMDAIEARHPPEASLDYDVIPDTPEQRSHIARHMAEFWATHPNLRAMLDDAT